MSTITIDRTTGHDTYNDGPTNHVSDFKDREGVALVGEQYDPVVKNVLLVRVLADDVDLQPPRDLVDRQVERVGTAGDARVRDCGQVEVPLVIEAGLDYLLFRPELKDLDGAHLDGYEIGHVVLGAQTRNPTLGILDAGVVLDSLHGAIQQKAELKCIDGRRAGADVNTDRL